MFKLKIQSKTEINNTTQFSNIKLKTQIIQMLRHKNQNRNYPNVTTTKHIKSTPALSPLHYPQHHAYSGKLVLHVQVCKCSSSHA